MGNKKRIIKKFDPAAARVNPCIVMDLFLIRVDPRSRGKETQNKMRPRPATWAALLVRASRFTALGGEVCARKTAFPKERTFLAHPAGDPSTNPEIRRL
jgi:hypothetical protein